MAEIHQKELILIGF